MTGPRIVRLVGVTDTRTYEEVGDRWVPIPGSGTLSQCARCGRDHEVHAEVELEGGGFAVVGVSCARESSLEPEVKRAAAGAKTTAKLKHQLAAEVAKLERLRTIVAEVDALPVPEVVFGEAVLKYGHNKGQATKAARCGDGVGLDYWGNSTDKELTEAARLDWRHKRLQERGTTPGSASLQAEVVKVLERRLRAREAA